MPLFPKHDPDLGALVAYIVARARDRGVTLNQTKLVKLLYLIDVERAASGRPLLTGLRWIFFHYGPYALELPRTLEPMEGTALIVDGYKDARLYRAAPDAPDGEDWPPATRRQVDEIIRRFVALDLNELLDYVYFHTSPMRGAIRGQALDMSRARSEPERRAAPPLSPPDLPADASKRLANWRQRRREQTRPVAADAGRAFLTDPQEEWFQLGNDRGRLVISPDAEAEPPC
ncbi:MAG TPA: hypothetical protein VMB05_04780 [Solirubrobacteraceae bacterium]|nr:hypothetical protein [Solirubrobacteraceae bacterium]